MKGYKILYSGGRAPNQSNFTYPPEALPQDGEPGEWQECDRSRPLQICAWGFHIFKTPEKAKASYGREGSSRKWTLYECELDTKSKKNWLGDHEKVTGYRIRFLRAIEDQDGPIRTPADYVWA